MFFAFELHFLIVGLDRTMCTICADSEIYNKTWKCDLFTIFISLLYFTSKSDNKIKGSNLALSSLARFPSTLEMDRISGNSMINHH